VRIQQEHIGEQASDGIRQVGASDGIAVLQIVDVATQIPTVIGAQIMDLGIQDLEALQAITRRIEDAGLSSSVVAT
jgi:hypothetical protein